MVNWKDLPTVGNMVENEQKFIQEFVEIFEIKVSRREWDSMLGGCKFRSLLFWSISSQTKSEIRYFSLIWNESQDISFCSHFQIYLSKVKIQLCYPSAQPTQLI